MDYTLLMILDMATGFAIAVMFIYCIIGMVYHIQLKDNKKLKEKLGMRDAEWNDFCERMALYWPIGMIIVNNKMRR